MAVVGLADPDWGQRVVALYTGPAEPAAVEAHCRARLASYKAQGGPSGGRVPVEPHRQDRQEPPAGRRPGRRPPRRASRAFSRKEKITQVRTTANSIGYLWAALFTALAECRGVSPGDFGLFIQNDVLKEFIARGTQIFPPGPSLKLAADTIEHCVRRTPRWVPLAMSGYHIAETGGDAAQEVGYTFANAVAYLGEVTRRGVDIDWHPRALACIESGFFGRELADSAYRRTQAVECGERVVVGVNHYRSPSPPLVVFAVDPALETEQAAAVRAVRARRDPVAAGRAPAALAEAARGGDNVVPAWVAAVAARATVGEVVAALREVHGPWRPSAGF